MIKLATPEAKDLQGGGDYLKKPGKYHLIVERVRVGVSSKGKTVDGSTIDMKVMAGPEEGKLVSMILFGVKLDASEKAQAMAIKRLTNFFLATNVLQPSQLGTEIEIDEELANGQQFVAQFGWARKDDGNGNYVDDTDNIDWYYANTWHVDDPRVKDVVKSSEALELIDADKRHKPEWFAAITGEPVSTIAADSEPNFDDI